jgi:putative nucleotidyltransferase with HDIG domain
MKRLNTSELVPGMTTAADVYTYNNQLILPKGLLLTDKTITKLEFYSVFTVMVEDEIAAPKKENLASETPYSERVKSSANYIRFKSKFDEEIQNFERNLNDIVIRNKPVDVKSLITQTTLLLDNNDSHVSFFDLLHNMRHYDDPTFAHSINVALICNVFAIWLKFSPEDIQMATACGLLHDVGKLKMPEVLIKKPSELTNQEYSIIKTHTTEGYNILKNENLSDHIKNAALMHHERCDGTGYPLGIKQDRIDRFAKIVAIADVYEAMTSPRIYRGPLCPFKVIELFENEGLQKYEIPYIMTFLENVVYTYMLNRVRLNNGKEGEIIYINKNNLSRPIVKCNSKFYDLSSEHDLYIDALL